MIKSGQILNLRPLLNIRVPANRKELDHVKEMFTPLSDCNIFPLPPSAVATFNNLKDILASSAKTAISLDIPFRR
ncbi:hypothetical protein GJ496_005976 [Pomphorhynchus laevis]|nr:hypothetical protein GJ496_005976 [Pomphorhynchus laevis]